MNNDLVIDFETRSECDLKKCGTYVYASHVSTSILCLGYSYKDELCLWDCKGEFPEALRKAIVEADKIVAHNYQFEYWIWNITGVNKYNFPFIPIERWDCTSARATAYSLPKSLEKLSEALELPIKKDMKGNRVMLKLSKPRKATKNNSDKWHDDKEDFDTLYKYCLKDVEVQTLINKKIYNLSDSEKEVWRLDFEINQRGIPIDIPLVIKARDFCNIFIKSQNEKLRELTNGEVNSTGQLNVFREYCKKRGIDLPDLSIATVNEALQWDLTPDIKMMLEIRKSLAKSSIKKLEAMINRTASDNKIRGGLVYHGASTGRWAGSGIQIQNFPRPLIENPEECLDFLKDNTYEDFIIKYPDVLAAISSCLRYFITASEGKEFIVSDFSAIEARMIFYLAECEKGLSAFREGRDIYKEMASRIFKKETKDITKDERQLGKQAILGASYSMGASKFKMTCEGYGMNVSNELAELAIKTYRDTYKEIPSFWYGIENAAIDAVKTHNMTFYKNVRFKVINNCLFCQLPSGRKLAYNAPKLKKISTPWGAEKDQLTFLGVDSLTKKWVRQSTYGGKLVENITQASARDVMVNSMLNVEKNNYPVVFTVHDELVCEVEQNKTDIEGFNNVMSASPKWAFGLPLNVDTYISKRYKK